MNFQEMMKAAHTQYLAAIDITAPEVVRVIHLNAYYALKARAGKRVPTPHDDDPSPIPLAAAA